MNKLLFGTTNPAKILQIRGALAPIGIEVEGVSPEVMAVEVIEDGVTASDNARKKARTYSAIAGQPVFAMDNALYFDGVTDGDQPGKYVRRIKGSSTRPTDAEVIAYYSAMIRELGGDITGRWEFAVCIAKPDGKYFETVITSPRRFVSTPSKTVVEGYPMESLQIDPQSGKHISELSQAEQDAYWQLVIGEPLAQFVRKASQELGL